MSGIGQNFEGDFNAPVHNYNGYSEKEFEKELRSRLEKKDLQIAALEAENLSLRQQLALALSDKHLRNSKTTIFGRIAKKVYLAPGKPVTHNIKQLKH